MTVDVRSDRLTELVDPDVEVEQHRNRLHVHRGTDLASDRAPPAVQRHARGRAAGRRRAATQVSGTHSLHAGAHDPGVAADRDPLARLERLITTAARSARRPSSTAPATAERSLASTRWCRPRRRSCLGRDGIRLLSAILSETATLAQTTLTTELSRFGRSRPFHLQGFFTCPIARQKSGRPLKGLWARRLGRKHELHTETRTPHCGEFSPPAPTPLLCSLAVPLPTRARGRAVGRADAR